MQERVCKARHKFRKENNVERYSGWLHLILTLIVTLSIMGVCAVMLGNVSALEWLTIPVVFLYANLSEYLGHKGPMHHKTRFLGLIFKRHTLEHHTFFTQDETTIDSAKDFKAIMFPPIMLVFFFGCFALPVAILIYYFISQNVALLFVFMATFYFLNYELLHLAYHLEPDSLIGRLPFMKVLRRHHTLHHDQRLMGRYNFNISYPVFDFVFGTIYQEPKN